MVPLVLSDLHPHLQMRKISTRSSFPKTSTEVEIEVSSVLAGDAGGEGEKT